MVVYVGICPIGVFALKDGKIIDSVLFPKDPLMISEKMELFSQGEGFEELDELILKLGEEEIDRSPQNPANGYLKKNLRMLAIGKGIQPADLNKLLSQIGIAKSRQTIKTKERKDRLIVQVVSAVGDLDKILNTMSERMREWFGLHYPEFRLRDHFRLAKKIAKYGHRKNFEDFKESMGVELTEEDEMVLKTYAENLANLYKQREVMEKYLDKTTKEEMPNLRGMLGGTLAARLLSKAGTLERLAKMPSSKLQLLGSEKSVFRFMKEKKQGIKGAKIPKFGILFTHPDISGSPHDKRGKIARLLASKCTMAARMDYYSNDDRSAELLKDYHVKRDVVLAQKSKDKPKNTKDSGSVSNKPRGNFSRGGSGYSGGNRGSGGRRSGGKNRGGWRRR